MAFVLLVASIAMNRTLHWENILYALSNNFNDEHDRNDAAASAVADDTHFHKLLTQ